MVQANPWWLICLTGFYSSDLHIPMLQSLFLQKLHYVFQSCKLCSPFQSLRAANSPKKHLKCFTDTARFETGRQHWRQTSQSSFCSHAQFAVPIPELVFTSVTGCLSSLLFRSPAGYPKQYQLCNGEEGSFLPKVLMAKSQTTEWNSVCQSPNCRNKKKKNQTRKKPQKNQKKTKTKKKLFCPPIFPVSPNSPWLMANTLENIRFFQIRRPYFPTTVPFQGKSQKVLLHS